MNTAVIGSTTSAPSCCADRGSLTRDEMITASSSATSVISGPITMNSSAERTPRNVCQTPGSADRRDPGEVEHERDPHHGERERERA